MEPLRCYSCGANVPLHDTVCSYCGNTVRNEPAARNRNANVPTLPSDLRIGRRELGIKVEGQTTIFPSDNQEKPVGMSAVYLHTHGVMIENKKNKLSIHYAQIKSLQRFSREEMILGLNSMIGHYYLEINYWNPRMAAYHRILINDERADIDAFINQYNLEIETTRRTGRKAETKRVDAVLGFFLKVFIFITLSIGFILFLMFLLGIIATLTSN